MNIYQEISFFFFFFFFDNEVGLERHFPPSYRLYSDKGTSYDNKMKSKWVRRHLKGGLLWFLYLHVAEY